MQKDQLIIVEGIVESVLPDTTFRVKIKLKDYEAIIIAHTSGKMRKNRLRILEGDKVIMEVSKYDKTKGRITRRMQV